MKKLNYPRVFQNRGSGKTALAAAVLLLLCTVFSGCPQLLGKPEKSIPEDMGILTVSLLKDGVSSGESGRTILALDPDFTSYELYLWTDLDGTIAANPASYTSSTGFFQITLPNATYYMSAAGYTGDKETARTRNLNEPAEQIEITSATVTEEFLSLKPYMDPEIYGALHYSLNWDGVGQIPARAELLVEQYNQTGNDWSPIPISLIADPLTAGPRQGTILLVQRETGLVQQTGALALPPGEYRLTTSVTMDGPNPPVSRTDVAHVYSNLITPAAFAYSQGDLIVTNPGTDLGSGFITKFNFTQTPEAVSIIGSNPGPDGTRSIIVMVPAGTDLTRLTPVVECADGARITSPPPKIDPDSGIRFWDPGDYTSPSSWTAEGRNGVIQPYTVIVTKPADDSCLITGIAFEETRLAAPPEINQTTGSIEVTVPYGTVTDNPYLDLTPVFSYTGVRVMRANPLDPADDTPLSGVVRFKEMPTSSPEQNFRVYAHNGATKLYTVMITEAADNEAEITGFVFEGYPEYPGTVTQPVTPNKGTIAVKLPYGTGLNSLTPLVTYRGRLAPASGEERNFSGPVDYTVESWDDSPTTTKVYTVTVSISPPNADTGILDFVITNVPRAKVVIGTKPRADGKIPIVVQVPYAASPLIEDDPSTPKRIDLKKLMPKITLASDTSVFIDPEDPDPSTALPIPGPNTTGSPTYIPFNNQYDYQEAVYRIRAQGGNTQDYVVLAARDVQYYYVKATGKDDDPDQYNGGSESTPFKTLAYAVYQAVKHNVDHIYVIGVLNDASEGGAWEDTAATGMGDAGTYRSSGGPQVAGGNSVFNLNGAGLDNGKAWRIYITGIGSNAAIQGAAGKRVISITGGAHITFDNINIQDGGGASYGGNGGGMYIGGSSTVIWKSGNISNNRAVSGGGVYVDNSEFDFKTGSINANIASGSAVSGFEQNDPSIQGGGGVYVYGEDSLFWFSGGDITNNSTAGSGGGVLLNGSVIPDSPTQENLPHNFIMGGGSVNSNTSSGAVWPHGGGGVFVAKGTFEMMDGRIMYNNSNRQGGGVFVWSRSLFYMDGNSSVTANEGRGSAKAICSRGITTLRGNAQADKVYIWNYAKGTWNNGFGDEFTLREGARISGLVLAFADDPQDNRNYINIVSSGGSFFTAGTGPITTIDLESRLLSNGAFSPTATIAGDWQGKYLIKNGGNEIPSSQADEVIKRFPLGSYTYGNGSKSISQSAQPPNYKLLADGKLAPK